jgi:hypothetical protein
MTAVSGGCSAASSEAHHNINVDAPTGVITQSVVETPLYELFNYLQYMLCYSSSWASCWHFACQEKTGALRFRHDDAGTDTADVPGTCCC